jgi:hypothetical protein
MVEQAPQTSAEALSLVRKDAQDVIYALDHLSDIAADSPHIRRICEEWRQNLDVVYNAVRTEIRTELERSSS